MSTLTFEGVSLEYGTSGAIPVLDAINLGIRSDEFVAVIGRSGSGKTSLLNLAAGFLTPSKGRIAIDGTPVTKPGADRAVVFQDDALYPWLDARDNIAFPLRLRGTPEAERHRIADQLLAHVGLPGAGDKKIWELSGGMRQRVGIARALASKPQFLLLDEPLGALDALTREKLQSFLLNVWAESGAGVMLITHSIEEALFLGTRIVVLSPNPGRIAADIPVSFGRALLAGEQARTIKKYPEFQTLHDTLTDLIHDTRMDNAA
ncbi:MULTISPECIES: taurine ABC transporter ATP-binding protein [unclassified Rhizobium]|uniref:taurine ABC transporter ATP-binding protein n=1 Tax=unclassified Rhizobium TaxID=2613769 RepID=UPI00071342F8|nr:MULTISPECIES: ATP-binding cassette domain-containing protein [unclassified Rhizobium]KQS89510.1 taurine transporter ATP-binding subunit [Rhizobium sp. Leaf391]KQS94789.1 taurine transporter ATP-binding subunit [Rhizobium sp. Leaf386]KQU01167.1 taurine transporter ATP-binding subunit [Rhizobium sp. Leaf453]